LENVVIQSDNLLFCLTNLEDLDKIVEMKREKDMEGKA
jgi:hypothetical protein